MVSLAFQGISASCKILYDRSCVKSWNTEEPFLMSKVCTVFQVDGNTKGQTQDSEMLANGGQCKLQMGVSGGVWRIPDEE